MKGQRITHVFVLNGYSVAVTVKCDATTGYVPQVSHAITQATLGEPKVYQEEADKEKP